MLHIVLHEPEMPANTGNIGRTCVACGAVLHLIEPLGFKLNEKMIKRAGLDYWEHLDVRTYLMFGKESAGIPEEILLDYKETAVRIPMLPEIRSLNLSNSVAIVAYEVLRQQRFDHFQREGQLHRYEW